jgi:uncharacterized membrane protein YoaT (DUF817 family)
MSPALLAAGRAFEARVRPAASAGPLARLAYEFLKFGLKQAWASLFGAMLLSLIVATHYLWPAEAPLSRYDALTLAAIAIQIALLALKLEQPDEALVILVFHLLGTAMEVFKTAKGSWIYPEASLIRIGGVPLFSGFMYASIGSYIARIWRLLDVRFARYPPAWATWLLAVAAYANFFTHHFMPDIRWALFATSAVLFGRTWFSFQPDGLRRRMPMLLGLVLVAAFIWIAENLGTFASAWIYPSQRHGWGMVPVSKLGAWYLLILLSFVLVTAVRRPRVWTHNHQMTMAARQTAAA